MEQLADGDDEANAPLAEEALSGLIPAWVATRRDLNEVEAENVASGIAWITRRRVPLLDQLSTQFVSQLHSQMFGDVWQWAGTYRQVDLNLGCKWHAVTTEVKQLLDDFTFRLEEERRPSSGSALDSECVEYHHRMVSVHPFLNGNGRHARAAADALVESMGRPPFEWGRRSIVTASQTRSEYVAALRSADSGDLDPLVRFARS